MKFILIIFMAVLLVGTVSATNIKTFDDNTYTIKNFLSLGPDLATIKLIDNTDVCGYEVGLECNATLEVEIFDDQRNPLDGIRFLNRDKKERELEVEVLLETGIQSVSVTDYDWVCNEIKEDDPLRPGEKTTVAYDKCSWKEAGSHMEDQMQYKYYSEYEELKPGTYRFIIRSDKKSSEDSVDWQTEFMGAGFLTEWAWWNSAPLSTDILYYFPMNESTGSFIQEYISGFNATTFNQWDWTVDDLGNTAIEVGDAVNNSIETDATDGSAFDMSSGSHTWCFIANITSNEVNQMVFGKDRRAADVWRLDIKNSDLVYHERSGVDPVIWSGFLSTDLVDTWHSYCFVWFPTNVTIYVDGVVNRSNTINKGNSDDRDDTLYWGVQNEVGGYNPYQGGFSQWTFWTRAITPSEISLWDSKRLGDLVINLITPADQLKTFDDSITFNCSGNSTANEGVVGLSLKIDDLVNSSVSNTTANQNISLQSLVTGFSDGDHNWTCNITGSLGTTSEEGARDFSIIDFTENSNTFNSSSSETSQEQFVLNITTKGVVTPTAKLFYGGVDQGAGTLTGNATENIFTKSLQVPLVTGETNKSVYWELTLGAEISNTTFGNQTVNDIIFGLCNSTLTTPYINFTFKNETISTEDITATFSSSWTYFFGSGELNNTLIFINATENTNYTFCFSPPERPLNVIYSLDYNNAGSQQRSSSAVSVLSNSTSSRILYLLPTSLGLFSPFRTTTVNLESLSGVLGTITRSIGGSTITVASSTTDDSGFATYFLNPDASYDAVFSKTGFPQNSFSFTPTTETRTVIMGSQTGAIANGTTISYNTSYSITPKASVLSNNTNFTFGFNLTSTQTITFISMNLTNSSGTQLFFTSNAGQGFISGNINTENISQILGKYVYKTSNETFSVTKTWIIAVDFIGDYSIFRQMTLYVEYGFDDFWRLLFVVFIIMGTLIFMSANEVTDTSESKVIASVLLIWAFSVVGWLNTGLASNSSVSGIQDLAQFSSQYGIAIISSAFGFYFVARRLFIRRI